MRISTDELRELLQETAVQLLDVRLADDFEAAHLPGAHNNCVFEVSFEDRLDESAPRKDAVTIVYGAHQHSHESRMAAEKLSRLGYTDVRDYREGINAWNEAGESVEEGPPLPPPPPITDGRHEIDLGESRLDWTGRNLLNKHEGVIGLKGGFLELRDGQLAGGEVVIDMEDITCTDLEGQMHDLLVAHLKSDDFFDTAKHPEAVFRITWADPLDAVNPGGLNMKVSGTLTLKGITQDLAIDAATGITSDGKAAAQAAFGIDRTRWGVIYGSGKLFARLAGHLVNDRIELELRLVTK